MDRGTFDLGGRRWPRAGGWPGASRASGAILVIGLIVGSSASSAQEGATPPHWIWHPTGVSLGETPAETRYFRRAFTAKLDSRLFVDVTADNAFTLYLDGRPIATGGEWQTLQHVEMKVAAGKHVLAASASNEAPGPAGFLLGGGLLPLGQGVPVHTDSRWKSNDRVPPGDGWTRVDFDDSRWVQAHDLGPLGSGPWTGVVSAEKAADRFRVPAGFRVTMAASPAVTGSVVAFTFDEGGAPCVSIEGGPVARLIDEDGDGRFDRREVIESQVTNCQGILFDRGRLFVVGDGPAGTGLYRLSRPSRRGVYGDCELIRGSRGGMGEHGPHAIAVGPDGLLYHGNGNHAHLRPPIDPRSPASIAYEGELLPHYNDARGHAAGVMAPGGEIFRSDDAGRTWKRVVAGFRNQYDFAFNRDGELFTFDSDMEWDVGLPWYRPVRVNHCAVGAEFGWRNGTGKWPPYYFDSLPAAVDIGRGSPTGVTFYQSDRFPPEYRDNFLICDWSQGRILAVRLDRRGASYGGTATELVTGQPLNCTDIEVGPDGAVYFTTGGRGTQGGLFRVSWEKASPRPDRPALTVRDAIAIDSPLSAFSRHRIAAIRDSAGAEWPRALEAMARDPGRREPGESRVRAIDLLAQFGPRPEDVLLIDLSTDRDAAVRARAVALLGQRTAAAAREALVRRLSDPDPFVRRRACEGLMQQPVGTIPIAPLIPLLADPDRWIRFAARVAIEHGDVGGAADRLLAIRQPRPLVEAMLAIVRADHIDASRQDGLLRRQIELLGQRPAPELAADLLRLIELTYLLGPRKADAPASASLRPILLGMFATADDTPANREVARLLAFLQEPRAVAMIVEHQARVGDHQPQIHDAYCLRAMKAGWTAGSKRRLWTWYQDASQWEGGYSFQGYLDLMIQDLVALLDDAEKSAYLADAAGHPFPARVLVRQLDLDSASRRVPELLAVYRKLDDARRDGAPASLREEIIEKLGTSRLDEARAALRQLYVNDPDRRDLIVRAIAARPDEKDLPILAAALGSRDANTTGAVLRGLRSLSAVPEGPGPLAALIRLARRSGPGLRDDLDLLAARWTGAERPDRAADYEAALEAWEEVYRRRYPGAPPIAANEPNSSKPEYTLPMLVERVVRSGLVKGASARRGEATLERARCLQCHKFGSKGEGVGPDLSTLGSRFRPEEILESIVEPSKVISDQYKPVTIATVDGKIFSGMPIVSDGPNVVLLLSDGTKVTIPRAEIEARKESAVSVMPAGLINDLTPQEIADLLALLSATPAAGAPGGVR